MTIRNPAEYQSLQEMPMEIYVLVRVSSIRSQASLRFYADPWRRLYEGDLYHASDVQLGLKERY